MTALCTSPTAFSFNIPHGLSSGATYPMDGFQRRGRFASHNVQPSPYESRPDLHAASFAVQETTASVNAASGPSYYLLESSLDWEPLRRQVQRRVPTSPEELQSSMIQGHYVGRQLNGSRVPLPNLPATPQNQNAGQCTPATLLNGGSRPDRCRPAGSGRQTPESHQILSPAIHSTYPGAVVQRAQQGRHTHTHQRTSSEVAPVSHPESASVRRKSQRHSWPQYKSSSEEVPDVTIHPVIKSYSPLNWDIRQKPSMARINSEGGLLLSESAGHRYLLNLSENAISGEFVRVEIELPNLRFRRLLKSWGPITVRSQPDGGVSLKDLLEGIHCHFRQRLTQDELKKIVGDVDDVKMLKDQYADRYYLTERTSVDEYRRSDILEGFTKFRALDVDYMRGEHSFATLRLGSSLA